MVFFRVMEATGAAPEVSCAWIIGGLVAAVVALAGYIATIHKAYSRKVNEIYDARIEDLKSNHALVDTLLRVVVEEKGGK